MDLLTALVGKEVRHDPLAGDPFWYQFGYPIYGLNQQGRADREPVPNSFETYVNGAYKASGPVFACELVRMSVFSEARFMWRQTNKGVPGDLFHTPALNILRHPWKGASTSNFLSRALAHHDFAGNAFILRQGGRLSLLRPDWVDIVLGVEDDVDDLDKVDDPSAEPVGYIYHPGGRHSKADPIPYTADMVAHFAHLPDPLANFRGMSWLTPVVRDIVGDKEATRHKNAFYEQGASPSLVVKGQWTDPDQMKAWTRLFRETHEGASNAYKTLVLGAGMDADAVGNDFQQLDFKNVQGAAETRIAAASGVGAVVAQLSEGLQGSSLNAGNYQAARRAAADKVFRPLWRDFCSSLEQIIAPPRNSELWYDETDIPFLKEDRKDKSEIQSKKAVTVRTLTDAGYTAESVVEAVENDDFSLLEHSGLFSVQLQPPGMQEPNNE